MAKKSTTVAAPATQDTNKAEAIRKYAADHPGVGPSEIAKALTAQGIEVNASRVSTVLRNGTRKGGLDVAAIKAASEFVKGFKNIDDAIAAVEKTAAFLALVGPSNGKEAIDAYRSVADAIK